MTRTAAASKLNESPMPLRVTLLELVTAVSECTSDDEEVTATVIHMLRSGRAQLCGTFAKEPLEHFRV